MGCFLLPVIYRINVRIIIHDERLFILRIADFTVNYYVTSKLGEFLIRLNNLRNSRVLIYVLACLAFLPRASYSLSKMKLKFQIMITFRK